MYERFGKRGFDIVAATAAIVVLIIPGLIVALWIKLDSKGPVVFKQLRFGKDQKPFTIYKFRTMSTEAPSNMATNNFSDADNYITRSGKIMRKLSIDELPQILNILNGTMSIVGPRPVVLSETKLTYLREKQGANKVKPGITGWAQVNGRDEVSPAEKAELDGFYAERISLWFDIKCIAMTIWTVATLAGNSEGHEKKVKSALEPSVRGGSIGSSNNKSLVGVGQKGGV